MITPRRTRLLRARDLASFQRAIARAACHADVARARACAVLVPTRAAAGQLRRTLEEIVLGPDGHRVLALPELVTRDEWYARLHAHLPAALPLLSEFDREVMAGAAAREAVAAGSPPPFTLRPGLVPEILSLYDGLRRQHETLEDFERLINTELASSADTDRGADRLLQQTRFLAATFRGYEARVARAEALDEHGLRARLIRSPGPGPFRQLVVTVPDCVANPAGLWPADFDLLTRLPGLEQIDVVATEALLAAGFHERVHALLPELEEERIADPDTSAPVLVAPEGSDALCFTSRDREEELVDAVRALKASRRRNGAAGSGSDAIDDRTAIVFQRPLPYLYLARHIFEAAGVPYQALDSLPLGAEPYAAALDLVFSVVASGYTRATTVALLRSPHFAFIADGRPLQLIEIAALDRRLQAARYLGGRDHLARLAADWSREPEGAEPGPTERRQAGRAARVAATLAEELSPLERDGAASALLDTLLTFLRAPAVLPAADDPLAERQLRARAAILGALESLREAHVAHDDPPSDLAELASSIRRWIEAQTFAPRAGAGGVHLVDAQAARYGSFDAVHIVGLVETDWPARQRPNIFYPASLLGQLGWPKDADRIRAARAEFDDLLRLPRARVSLSSFTLEDDAIVGPSVLLEDLADAGLAIAREPARPALRVSLEEALCRDPVTPAVVSGDASAWLALRLARPPAAAAAFHGAAGPQSRKRYAVSALERYLECPFRYFAAHVLRLEEEFDDEFTMTPKTRGRFIHDVFNRFFDAWQRGGQGAITAENVDAAIALFRHVAEAALATLPAPDRVIEQRRLFGSATAPGIAERVFRLEAERPSAVLERLLEYRLEGEFILAGDAGPRRVSLHGVADRIDLLDDGTLRVIDYKTGAAPKPQRALQLPTYASCAAQTLARHRGRQWQVGEAGYVAFGEARGFVSMVARGGTLTDALEEGQRRFLKTLDDVERGDFPPRPADMHICTICAYPTVCRKDYVGEE